MNFNPFETGIKTVLMVIFTSFSLSFFANSHLLTKSYSDHLSEINKEWLNHKEACPTGSISFSSDLDRIQLHLNLVIGHLKTNIPSGLNSAQLSNRLSLLDQLQDYADLKVFPVNKYHSIRTPYFVDAIGTNCAVGQMIYVSGHKDLVERISKEHNYDYIKDIHTEGILEWANEFGFTLEELKWIQPAYGPTHTIDQVLDGTNGTVNVVVESPEDESLIIAGAFTELDSLPCLNIGKYKNNQLSCLGSGIDGIINDVIALSSGVFVFGEIHHNSQVFPMAKYDGIDWSYIEIPTREGATSTTGNKGGPGYIYEIAINHSSIAGHQEIWHYMFNFTWEKQTKVKGFILDMDVTSYGRVYVGHFDTVIVYDSNALVDTTFLANNVLFRANFVNEWFGIGNEVSDTIKVVKNIAGGIVFGGTCSNETGGNKVCMSRYSNSVLEPLFLNEYGPNDYSVNTIVSKNDELYIS